MKRFLLLLVFSFPILSFGQSIFSNLINGDNPNLSDPYITGQIVDPNITVSGIGRGTALFGINAKNRYNAKSWKSDSLNPNAYFEFTITPNAGKEIDFISFEFKGQASKNGPTLFAFRSSVDNFTSNVGVVIASGASISLTAAAFQNVDFPVTFRIYGWSAFAGTGSFSVNDFRFNGVVSCSKPKAPVLPETSLSCSATSFDLHWLAPLYAEDYFVDVATDAEFEHYLLGYQNKKLSDVTFEKIYGLTAGGTYYVRMRSSNHCGTSLDSNIIVVATPVTIYNHGWSNGNPDPNKNVVFLSNFNVATLLEACSCQIGDGVVVHVDAGAIIRLDRELNVAKTATLTFENNASLIQVDNFAVNTGEIHYKRTTSEVKDFDYVYWSSPVKDQKLNKLSPLSDRYYSFKINNWSAETNTNTMNDAGNGFIIRVPKGLVNQKQNVEFIGVPYNGTQKIASQGAYRNSLIGNPYPSAIDADSFIDKNKALIYGGLYFWTHNTPRTFDGSLYKYAAADYAVYTLTGGTSGGAEDPKGIWNGATSSVGIQPNGTIVAGQSFFVGTGAVTGEFEFNNDMRIEGTNKNTQFFRQASTKKGIGIEKNRIWLNLINEEGAFKQLLVGYITGATNNFDNLYDGTTLDGNTYLDFYSIGNSKKYAVQGRALPFDQADEVPLGYRTAIAGTFKIGIDNVDGTMSNQAVYLEDKTTNSIHNLKNGPYTFSTAIGTFTSRFVLRYTDTSKLGIGDVEAKGKGVVVSVKNSQIKVNSFDQMMASIKVYDLKGSLLYDKSKLNKNEFIIDHFNSSNQFLIVMVQLEDGKWGSEEIIF